MWSALALPTIFWALVTVAVTSFGYPGVVCATPAAWCLALFVGRDTVRRSKSADPRRRRIEAGVAGGALGLAQGMMFAAVALLRMVEQPEDVGRIVVISVGMSVGGAIVCAILAVAFGALYTRGTEHSRRRER